jgi:hypothetical protein
MATHLRHGKWSRQNCVIKRSVFINWCVRTRILLGATCSAVEEHLPSMLEALSKILRMRVQFNLSMCLIPMSSFCFHTNTDKGKKTEHSNYLDPTLKSSLKSCPWLPLISFNWSFCTLLLQAAKPLLPLTTLLYRHTYLYSFWIPFMYFISSSTSTFFHCTLHHRAHLEFHKFDAENEEEMSDLGTLASRHSNSIWNPGPSREGKEAPEPTSMHAALQPQN